MGNIGQSDRPWYHSIFLCTLGTIFLKYLLKCFFEWRKIPILATTISSMVWLSFLFQMMTLCMCPQYQKKRLLGVRFCSNSNFVSIPWSSEISGFYYFLHTFWTFKSQSVISFLFFHSKIFIKSHLKKMSKIFFYQKVLKIISNDLYVPFLKQQI